MNENELYSTKIYTNCCNGSHGCCGCCSNVGPAGPMGLQGPPGPQGPAGPQGAQGPPGATGPQGIPGPAGPVGATGATGATGPQGPQGPAGPTGATGATGATGPQGPIGETATNQNAMRYNVPSQSVAAGEIITLLATQINSTGDIIASGTGGLTLAAGQYLVSFSTDALAADDSPVGAALFLDGTELIYGAMQGTSEETGGERLATTVILTLANGGTVTAQNNTEITISYANSVLTAVKLA